MLIGRHKQAGVVGLWGAASLWFMMGGLPVIRLIMKWSQCGITDDRECDGGGD